MPGFVVKSAIWVIRIVPLVVPLAIFYGATFRGIVDFGKWLLLILADLLTTMMREIGKVIGVWLEGLRNGNPKQTLPTLYVILVLSTKPLTWLGVHVFDLPTTPIWLAAWPASALWLGVAPRKPFLSVIISSVMEFFAARMLGVGWATWLPVALAGPLVVSWLVRHWKVDLELRSPSDVLHLLLAMAGGVLASATVGTIVLFATQQATGSVYGSASATEIWARWIVSDYCPGALFAVALCIAHSRLSAGMWPRTA